MPLSKPDMVSRNGSGVRSTTSGKLQVRKRAASYSRKLDKHLRTRMSSVLPEAWTAALPAVHAALNFSILNSSLFGPY